VRERDPADQLQVVADDELTAIRRDLRTGIAMMRRESPMHASATAYLAAVNAELNRRARLGDLRPNRGQLPQTKVIVRRFVSS